jgi:hypothetical protein
VREALRVRESIELDGHQFSLKSTISTDSRITASGHYYAHVKTSRGWAEGNDYNKRSGSKMTSKPFRSSSEVVVLLYESRSSAREHVSFVSQASDHQQVTAAANSTLKNGPGTSSRQHPGFSAARTASGSDTPVVASWAEVAARLPSHHSNSDKDRSVARLLQHRRSRRATFPTNMLLSRSNQSARTSLPRRHRSRQPSLSTNGPFPKSNPAALRRH